MQLIGASWMRAGRYGWPVIVAALCMAGVLSTASATEPLSVQYPITPPQGDYKGKDVQQPIEFPHDVHTVANKINCLYCHSYGRQSKVAGIPPTSTCMGCHSVIATDKPRIQQLTQYWENKQPIPWLKVHDLPDFVRFTHERHLKRFIFDNPEIKDNLTVDTVAPVCAMCHGDLRTMTVAKKVTPMTMGWCVECHEKNDGPADCWSCHK